MIQNGATLQVKMGNLWGSRAPVPQPHSGHWTGQGLHMLSGSGGPHWQKTGLTYHTTVPSVNALRCCIYRPTIVIRQTRRWNYEAKCTEQQTTIYITVIAVKTLDLVQTAEALRNWYYGTEATAKRSSYSWECSHVDSWKYHV